MKVTTTDTSTKHKPVIETLINTAAIGLSVFGTSLIINNGDSWGHLWRGIIIIVFGAGLEFFKYWGRFKKLW